uniref:hypothetical protein n=1 Tax=uncultured Erythrobacter sp. TaxID=263913 RepID=UPI002637DDD7|nr:hypothetical protein [uncultured Erythrobacter sp.]
MDLLKSLMLGAVLSGTLAIVIGSQGSTGGAMDIQSFRVDDMKLYWSWPVFFGGSGLAWALMLLQK